MSLLDIPVPCFTGERRLVQVLPPDDERDELKLQAKREDEARRRATSRDEINRRKRELYVRKG